MNLIPKEAGKLSIVLFVLLGCAPLNAVSQGDRLCFEDHCFQLEMAVSQEELFRGLQFREHLPQEQGMLFVFAEEDIHPFWMKDTLLSLDMLWLDSTRRVVHIEQDVPPCTTPVCPSYKPAQKALYVFEINAGLSERLGIQVGDPVQIFSETLN